MDRLRNLSDSIWSFCKNYVTVEPVIFLYMTAIFMEVSITQDLLNSKNCLTYTNVSNYIDCGNLTKDDKKFVNKETTKWISYYSGCLFAFTMLAASYVGSWSDKFSRKYTMLIPPVGSMVATVVAILNGYYIEWPIGLVLISGAISGISGGIVTLIASAFGYVVDITTVEQRTKRIVVLEAMIFLGATLGMLAGGSINKYCKKNHPDWISYGVVYGFEMILLVITVAYILIRIKETRNEPSTLINEPNESLLYRLFNLNHITDSVKTVIKPRNDNRRAAILLLLTVAFLSYFAIGINSTLLFEFLRHDPLDYDQTKYSYYQGASFAISGAALIIGLPVAFRFLHIKDTTLAIVGEFSKMLGLIVLGLSQSDGLVYTAAVCFIFSEFPVPVIRSILSKIAEPDEKGKLFALMQLLQNLCMLISSQLFNWLYVVTYDHFPGSGFEIVAVLQFVAILILAYLHFKFQINSARDGTLPYNRLLVNNEEYQGSLPGDA